MLFLYTHSLTYDTESGPKNHVFLPLPQDIEDQAMNIVPHWIERTGAQCEELTTVRFKGKMGYCKWEEPSN